MEDETACSSRISKGLTGCSCRFRRLEAERSTNWVARHIHMLRHSPCPPGAALELEDPVVGSLFLLIRRAIGWPVQQPHSLNQRVPIALLIRTKAGRWRRHHSTKQFAPPPRCEQTKAVCRGQQISRALASDRMSTGTTQPTQAPVPVGVSLVRLFMDAIAWCHLKSNTNRSLEIVHWFTCQFIAVQFETLKTGCFCSVFAAIRFNAPCRRR